MRIKYNKAYLSYSLYLLGVICGSILFFFFAQNFGYFSDKVGQFIGIISPFISGFVLAYLLMRPLSYVEELLNKHVYKNRSHTKLMRGTSIVIVYVIMFIFLFILSSIVLPQLLESMKTLSDSLPGYIIYLQNEVTRLLINTGTGDTVNSLLDPVWKEISSSATQIFSKVVPFIVSFSMSIASKLLNLLVTFIVSIYILFQKEVFAMQIKKLVHAFIPKNIIKGLTFTINLIDDTFGRYINGQLTDALIVGTLCVVSMLILKLPYALLVGVIVACTNVIPMIGPFIGAIPSTFIILMAGNPMQAVQFMIFILVLQQIDGNILVPKIVGDSTGISGFWVLFAIIVGGGLFGILGIALCVPTLSVVFKLLKVYAEYRLRLKNLPINTSDYGRDMDNE